MSYEEQVERLKMKTLLIGLRLNIKTGMHLTSPNKIGGTCYSLIKNKKD